MADAVSITRRSMLVGAASVAAGAALPTQAAALPEGHMLMMLDGQVMQVDTRDIPAVILEQEARAGGFLDPVWRSRPVENAAYVCLRDCGDIVVSALAPSSRSNPFAGPRHGVLPACWSESMRAMVGDVVTVIGKVVG